MSKPPEAPSAPSPAPASNPFTKEAAAPRSSTAGFNDGAKIKNGLADAFTEARPLEARSALAGMSIGETASTKPLESADPPPAKKNPFHRKPAAVKPSEAKLGSESGNDAPAATGQGEDKVVTTSKGLEVVQLTAAAPEDFSQRVKEAQKPAKSADMEMTSENYTKVYKAREQERMEEEKKKAEEEARKKLALNASSNSQEEMAKNAALAQQARDLQAKMAYLRLQLGSGDNTSTNAAIDECRVALAQIPSGLQG